MLVIHGGGEFIACSPDTFLDELISRDVSLDRLRQKNSWKSNLQKTLGDAFDVIAPRMPHPDQPRFIEWSVWFEKIIPLLNSSVMLVGHSLGGLFLLKYLSETEFPKKIDGLFSVAAPYIEKANARYAEIEFAIPGDVSRVAEQAPQSFLYHSSDDPVVPYADLQKYRDALPGATARTFSDRGHFNGEHFPELVADIIERAQQLAE